MKKKRERKREKETPHHNSMLIAPVMELDKMSINAFEI